MNDREAWSRRCEAGATGGVNDESCVRSPDPFRPPIGGRGGAAPAWCARSLARVSRWSPSSFSGYVRRRGCRLTPTLDSPTHQTTPLRVPRSSGFRRTDPELYPSCHGPFRPPRQSPKPEQTDDNSSVESLNSDIQKLKERRDMLDKEISQLVKEGYRVGELENHISLLHEYNDVKDVAQMLLGKLALTRGVTTKELYPDFGLDLSD
ncbi:DNA repair protein SWI5 homolog [Peromyscus californicus insignis]|uniref:DNA repair protein SWI5 homolog n=1 Tax=Peromyscus californicus insignis TaxID=564181 RepID=UPI0022A66372|nr:DNA repair protein SWI5 homolog [Peromyscus californicus insignis]